MSALGPASAEGAPDARNARPSERAENLVRTWVPLATNVLRLATIAVFFAIAVWGAVFHNQVLFAVLLLAWALRSRET